MIPGPSFTLNAESAVGYLIGRGFDVRDARAAELSGGVSNVVILVEHNAGRLVLKQALPQLRVQQEWFSDIRRIFTESAGLRALHPLLPAGAIPQVLFEDRENYLFAMTAADPAALPWKSQLLAGDCDPRVAEGAASILGTIIRRSWQSPVLASAFADIAAFEELRLDPYYGRLSALYPDLRPYLAALMDSSRTRKVSLVHGDWSPKNILVHDGKAMAIDFEVLHFGDPSFDAAFLLNHLLLKTFHGIAGAPGLAQTFWAALQAELPSTDWFERQTLAHLGALLLARMDGKSPAEYIRDEDRKRQIREFARGLITSPPRRVLEVWERYANHH